LETPPFPPLDIRIPEIYPIVDSSAWVERLLKAGARMLQLRIKNLRGAALEKEVVASIRIAEQYDCRFFVNDYWEHAVKHGAYGVHLGQDDIPKADIAEIRRAGLRLGVSTHSFEEADIAKKLKPSYAAFGPIYETKLKKMNFAPQGAEKIKTWKEMFDCPIIAIGGITLEKAREVLRGGPDAISVVRDITLAESPEKRLSEWLALLSG